MHSNELHCNILYMYMMYFDHIHPPLPSLFLLTPIHPCLLPSQLIKLPSCLAHSEAIREWKLVCRPWRSRCFQPSSALPDLWSRADHWHPLASASSSDNDGKKEAIQSIENASLNFKSFALQSRLVTLASKCREAEAGGPVRVSDQRGLHRGISQNS